METTTDPEVDHASAHERLLRHLYLTWRTTSLATLASAMWSGRHSLRRPRATIAILLALSAQSLWSTVRTARQGRVDRLGLWSDTATLAIALQFCAPSAAADADREGDPVRDWPSVISNLAGFQAEASSFATASWTERAGVTLVMSAAHSLAQQAATGRTDPADLGQAVATFVFRMVLTGLLADVVKDNVDRLNAAHAQAVRDDRDRACRQARSRYVNYMQTRALGALDAITTAEAPRAKAIRRVASLEAARLRRLLLPEAEGRSAALARIIDEVTGSGIDVEVVRGAVDAGFDFPERAAEALKEELLACAAPAARGVQRVVLFVDVVDGELLATIRSADARREIRVGL